MIEAIMVGSFGFALANVIGFIALFFGMFRPEQSSGPLELVTIV